MENLQHVLNLCNQNKFDEALTILEKIVKVEPQNSEAWRLLAQIHWTYKNETEKAFDELIEALRCDPQNIWALLLMGNFYTKVRKDQVHAKEYYEKVLEYHSTNAIAINNIGATYMENNDFKSALPLLEKALELDNTYTNSYYGLALCYRELGRIEDAFEICHRGALQSSDRPENPAVREELIKLFVSVAKEVADKTNYLAVWENIKDELEAVDNTNIRITEDRNLNVHAKMEYAPLHAAKEHVIRYNPEKDFIGHLFIHEMMHLKMSQHATIAKKGKTIVRSHKSLSAFKRRYLKFLEKSLGRIAPAELDNFVVHLADGLGLQLMNSPLDLFVEHLIFNEYKIAHPIQMLSLFHMEQDNINSVKQSAARGIFPQQILYANKVMNIVSSMHFKEMYGIDLIAQYRPSRQELVHAQDLYEEFKEYLKTYNDGDEYELLEYFVQSFNMMDFIEIVDEDQVTAGMKADLSMKSDLKDLAKDALTRDEVNEANEEFAQKHQDGADATETMMMAMYMLAAMNYFDSLDAHDVYRIAIEIAMVGVTGIHPDKKYSIKSMPGKEFGGYELLAYYYVSWARAIPEKLDSLGLPFSKAYASALQMYNAKKGK